MLFVMRNAPLSTAAAAALIPTVVRSQLHHFRRAHPESWGGGDGYSGFGRSLEGDSSQSLSMDMMNRSGEEITADSGVSMFRWKLVPCTV